MAGEFEIKSGGKSIATGFTNQRLSPHAGSATFWSWLRPLGWDKLLAGVLPKPLPVFNSHLLPLEKALAFMHGLLCGRGAVEPADSKVDQGNLPWMRTEVPGTEVAELEYQSMSWPHPRRLVLILLFPARICALKRGKARYSGALAPSPGT